MFLNKTRVLVAGLKPRAGRKSEQSVSGESVQGSLPRDLSTDGQLECGGTLGLQDTPISRESELTEAS